MGQGPVRWGVCGCEGVSGVNVGPAGVYSGPSCHEMALGCGGLEQVLLQGWGGLNRGHQCTVMGQPSQTPLGTPVFPLQILVLWSSEKPSPPSGKWPQTTVPLTVIQGRSKVRRAGMMAGSWGMVEELEQPPHGTSQPVSSP